MSLQYSSSIPREKASLQARFVRQLQLMYYRYEVTFSAYVLTRGEKLVLNSIVVLFLSLVSFGIISFLAPFVAAASLRLIWLYKGTGERLVLGNNATSMWRELEPHVSF